MNVPEFQTDRNDHLRQHLVKLSTEAVSGPAGSAATSMARQPTWARRTWRVTLVVAATCVGLIAVGQTSVVMQSAQAASVLTSVADQISSFSDPEPGPGEYLLISTRANWGWSDTAGNSGMNVQTIDVYVPGDPTQDWVLDRDWGDFGGSSGEREIIHAHDGEFYGGPWTPVELDILPRDGQALYDYFNDTYTGGSASRDEDNFVRITDILRTGMVPADLRAGLYNAMALIPGVTTTEEQANFDGDLGIAIGRTEPLRDGERTEVIIDPDTGLVIGEREVATRAIFGIGSNNIGGHTSITYDVVDSAP